MEEKSRLSRLTTILTQLQSKRIVTASYLADRHNVSVRTIYRDIRTLEKSGIPIVTEEGKGYSIMEGYHLPPVVFTENEANALITLEQLAIKNKDLSLVENVSSALEKIKAILKYSQKDNSDLLANRIYFSGNNKEEKTSDNLMEIQLAITQSKVLTIDYFSSVNNRTKRVVEPFGIYSTNGDFLLIAFCRLRNSFRHFRIDFIEHIAVESEIFESHNLTIKEYFEKYVKNQKHP